MRFARDILDDVRANRKPERRFALPEVDAGPLRVADQAV
jgi:hypothetical protein